MDNRTLSRRKLLKGVAFVGLASVAAACQAPAPTAAPAAPAQATQPAAQPAAKPVVTIDWITPAAIGLERTMYENFAYKFMEANPDIKVKVSFEAWADYMTKLPTILAAGVVPDMIHQHMSIVQDYAQKGALMDLIPLMQRDGVKPEDYIPALFEAFSNKGKTYGIPKDSAAWGVYYNKTMFDAAKVPYPKDDWKIEDMINLALELTRDEKGNPATSPNFDATKIKQWGWAWWQNPTPTDSESTRGLIKALGGDWYDADYKSTLITSEPAIKLFKLMHELRCVKHGAPGTAEAQGQGDVFRAGLCAMQVGFHTTTFFAKQENIKFDYDVTFMPGGPGGQYVPVGCSGWALPAKAKNKEEGWKFIKFLVSLPVQKYIGEQKRWGVSLKEAVGAIEPDDKKPANFAKVHTDPFKGKTDRQVISFKFPPQQSKIKEFYSTNFDPIWTCGKSDVAAAAAATKKDVDALLASLNW
ncbi:MAG: sugar ABC transporter substrate-binding protein [Anaerolineae bacterium]|nr:sugar ABC transporter substrate-binding protein [Anaerolineae bacterium]